jgi:hypothetical protein
MSSSSLVAPAPRSSSACSAEHGVLPANVDLPKAYRVRVSTMLQRSATFRDQCRRIATAPWLRVRVRPDLRIAGMKNLHSLTVFHPPLASSKRW